MAPIDRIYIPRMKIFSGDGSQRNSLREVLRSLDRADGRQAIAFRLVFAAIDVAILAFFLLGPYLRSGPSYLIIDYAIAVWIAAEMVGRAPHSLCVSGFGGR